VLYRNKIENYLRAYVTIRDRVKLHMFVL